MIWIDSWGVFRCALCSAAYCAAPPLNLTFADGQIDNPPWREYTTNLCCTLLLSICAHLAGLNSLIPRPLLTCNLVVRSYLVSLFNNPLYWCCIRHQNWVEQVILAEDGHAVHVRAFRPSATDGPIKFHAIHVRPKEDGGALFGKNDPIEYFDY